ncbi:diacylglycerol/lipid kinase family protein [Microbacterium gorillae]|uniref:diacylglycerol/lipid kinase family protein n=1 Tax=Microbacterium gorillae TaxID=1231063 RepID=UPI00058DF57C|nr:diacylglycerol kinase family protein [Microbacterium gorillae]
MIGPTANATRVAALIYNPVKVDGPDLRAAVQAAAHRAGWAHPHFFETTVEDPGQALARQALAEGVDVVLVAGGDGPVRAVAEAMISSDVPLTIIPSGTGNLLARNLGLPLTTTDALVAAAFTGVDRSIDIGLAEVTRADGTHEEHAFVVMAGMGLDAAMIQNTSPTLKRSVGWVAYIDGAARSLPTARPFRMMFQVGQEHLRTTRAHSILWANCGELPARITLVPDASIADGLLDVALFQPRRWWEWVAVWRTVWWRNSVLRRTKAGRRIAERLAGTGAVRYYQGESLEAAVTEAQPIEFDGDELGHAVRMRGRVVPGGLRVRLPAASAAAR